MLYVSHRDKVEKEQRREAALAALDSIPEVTATPAATANTGSDSDTDTVIDTGPDNPSGI